MITYSLLCKEGGRQNNEDCTGMFEGREALYFALADGLGGHGKGEVASRIAVETSMEILSEEPAYSEDSLRKAFDISQQNIIEYQKADRMASDMKTTLVLLQVGEELIQWGHIGDSRLYYFQEKCLMERTYDHSVPQMLVAAGKLKEKKIRNHPDRNRLLRVMGIEWEQNRYELHDPIERNGNQQFLLCSDGFWELIEEKKMTSCLKKAGSPQQWIDMMEEVILKNGRKKEMDNYSAVAVWAGQEG
ncbi:serine/threonine protein phosphatase PrpC [Hungatella effluvii]|uniref:Serine/threonine protein phosphatase PrpC n=1 Tax=Hungatella effluvii TaxID=1096246 RepID=A0A2V3XXY5_9FIRM|nr:protein phosphatase 2C domain-containing protein [Hungatella effluvii]PXX48924.1 serine/threonine protein phosphatase PrpC [Hungatella effluvii]